MLSRWRFLAGDALLRVYVRRFGNAIRMSGDQDSRVTTRPHVYCSGAFGAAFHVDLNLKCVQLTCNVGRL